MGHDATAKPTSNSEYVIRSLTIEVDENEVESLGAPLSLGAFTSLFKTICLCDESSNGRNGSTRDWVLRLTKRIFFVVLIVPIPFYIVFAKSALCKHNFSKMGDADDTFEKIIGLQVNEIAMKTVFKSMCGCTFTVE